MWITRAFGSDWWPMDKFLIGRINKDPQPAGALLCRGGTSAACRLAVVSMLSIAPGARGEAAPNLETGWKNGRNLSSRQPPSPTASIPATPDMRRIAQVMLPKIPKYMGTAL
jgi:hypothetical protein